MQTIANPQPTVSPTSGRPGWRRAFQDLTREHSFEPLEVEGQIPADLTGTLFRNGPALFSTYGRPYQHWFDGDGAISAVRFGSQSAEGAVRLVQTIGLQEERRAGRALYGGYGTLQPGHPLGRVRRRDKNAANTSVMEWQGRLLALYEGDQPTELSPGDLQTIGETDLGVVARSFSAHPHYLPTRRATYNFGMRYGRTTQLDLYELPDVGLARPLGSVPVSRATMIHDFIATPNYLIFFAPPLKLHLPSFLLGRQSFSESLEWKPSLGTEVLVVPIDRPEEVVRFEVDPFYQWHFSNAFEREGQLVVDFVRYPDFVSNQWLGSAPTGDPQGELNGRFYRALVDPVHRTLEAEPLWETVCEFPRVAPSAIGQPYRYAYAASGETGSDHDLPRRLAKLDVTNGQGVTVTLGDAQYPSEPIFVPRPGAAAEDDGYLLALVYDAEQHRSHVAVLDARTIERGPVARAWFDHHIPFTFHGIWSASPAD